MPPLKNGIVSLVSARAASPDQEFEQISCPDPNPGFKSKHPDSFFFLLHNPIDRTHILFRMLFLSGRIRGFFSRARSSFLSSRIRGRFSTKAGSGVITVGSATLVSTTCVAMGASVKIVLITKEWL